LPTVFRAGGEKHFPLMTGVSRMSLPNSLTLLRIFFVPLLVVLLLTKEPNMDLWAVGVFLLAAITDLLDGYLARRRAQVSRVGILLDPIADKLLTSAAFISLVEMQQIPAWIVVIIIGREFAVSGLRSIASAEGFTMPASDLGKTKMVLQVVAITVIVLERRYPRLQPLGDVCLWLVVGFALLSAAEYFWAFWKKLDSRLKQQPPAAGRVVVFRGSEKEQNKKDAAAQ
jgi:CDP-diacylglycerol--glycerol-3-phosphate 3-phosphatidyltransferase